MSKRRKRIVKVKWKNLLLFISIIFLIIFFTTNGIKSMNSTTKTETTKKENPTITEEEKKLKELDNINEKIDYFNELYIDRYINYKNKNPKLDITQIIKNVNMNLDQTPYEYTKEAKNTNTSMVLVNKYYYLTEDYVPDNLQNINRKYALSNMRMVEEAKDAFEKLSKDAQENDLTIIAMSTYRSYTYQVNLYNRYKKQDGEEKADTYSGRPGHSEHQTGLAVDVYNKEKDYTKFETTKEYEWMMEHAHEYGFILRFPKGKENETGYTYEAWHFRYVGIDAATYIHNNNISLEEYVATILKDW